MWHSLPAMMPSPLHAISYASPLRWWILMIPIHFQCTGSKFIGEEKWDLSCNRMYGCHMSSRFKDVLKWKRNHIFKKQRIWGGMVKKPRRNSVILYFLLFILLIIIIIITLHYIFLFFLIGEASAGHFRLPL